MKKLVFSAIALLAFTATSFAAEGKKEVKKAEAKNEVKADAKKDVIVVSELCDSVYEAWMEMSPPLSSAAAHVAAVHFSLLCERTYDTAKSVVICPN